MSKLDKLIKLKEQMRDIWDINFWSSQWFTEQDKLDDDRLRNEISTIESEGIYCKCKVCGVENDTVDFKSESPNKLICDDCWDEIREDIKDKCGLL